LEERVSKVRYAEIVGGFAHRSILVVGDLMVDEYLRGTARRISQEGPVMVIEVEADEFKPGGAANVGNNLRTLGARVQVAGIVGDDEMGRLLRSELAAWEVGVSGILTDASRPTTRKTRVMAQNQQVLRIDREQTQALASELAHRLQAHVADVLAEVDAVLVSDYRKGVIGPEVARAISERARAAGKPLMTNPKPTSAPWLQGARVLSLNHFEAEELARARMPEEEAHLRPYGERLLKELDVETLVITRGARGLSYWRRDGQYRLVPAHAVEVADGAGAGDTTISAMTLALLCGADDYEAAVIANHAGACVVRKAGVATVSVEELLDEEFHETA
jgi:rfaE bifunctional protein kinase chain/domain